MALRNNTVLRTLSTTTLRQSFSPGMPVDTSSYTSTGGSGKDSTALSGSMDEATRKARGAYRMALRDIPEMRRNFSIMEEKQYVIRVVRDAFERHSEVSDPKIVDMLVFKALQELREIREQWKSRHHVYAYIQSYTEKMIRQQVAEKSGADSQEDGRESMLSDWRNRGLVPHEISNWAMFTRWKAEEDDKFRNFALDNNLFTADQLDARFPPASAHSTSDRKASSSCTVM